MRSAHVYPHGRGHDPSMTVHVHKDPDKKDARDWPHGQGMVLPYADLSAGSVMTTKEGPKATPSCGSLDLLIRVVVNFSIVLYSYNIL